MVFDDVKISMVNRVKEELEDYGDWYKDLLSPEMKRSLYMAKAEREFDESGNENTDEITYWDLISFKELEKIIQYGKNWTNFLQKVFEETTDSPDVNITKTKVLSDMKSLSTIEMKLNKNQSIIYKDYQTIKNIIKTYSIETNLEEV